MRKSKVRALQADYDALRLENGRLRLEREALNRKVAQQEQMLSDVRKALGLHSGVAAFGGGGAGGVTQLTYRLP